MMTISKDEYEALRDEYNVTTASEYEAMARDELTGEVEAADRFAAMEFYRNAAISAAFYGEDDATIVRYARAAVEQYRLMSKDERREHGFL